jgi:hypothetical protein
LTRASAANRGEAMRTVTIPNQSWQTFHEFGFGFRARFPRTAKG